MYQKAYEQQRPERGALGNRCPWCSGKCLEWTVIDEDFAQPLHRDFVHYCFYCGRRLYDKQGVAE